MSAGEQSSSERHEIQAGQWPARGATRILPVLDQLALIELVKLTLNHGLCVTRTAVSAHDAAQVMHEWQPHVLIFTCDFEQGAILKLVAAQPLGSSRLPAICLTRRGNLQTKLDAFEAGVDDIMSVPFAPEELLARVLALLRRSYSDAMTFTPVIKIGALEIDILHRTVRAGASRYI